MKRCDASEAGRILAPIAASLALATLPVTGCRRGALPDSQGCAGGGCLDGRFKSEKGRVEAEFDPFPTPHADPVSGFTDGWERVPWAQECPLFRPGTPSTLVGVPPLKWTTCVSGRSGCRQLVLDWAKTEYMWVADASGVMLPRGVVRMAFTRQYSPYQREYIVWEEDRGIVAAWRHDGPFSCLETSIGDVAAGTISLTLAIAIPHQTVRGIGEYRQILGEPADLLSRQVADVRFSGVASGFGGLFMSRSAASARVISMYYGQTNRLVIRDRATGTFDDLGFQGEGAGSRLVAPGQYIVGDAVFYSRGNEIDVWRNGAGERPLIRRADTIPHDIVTDGTALAWVESSNPDTNGHFRQNAIFTSPFTVDPARVASQHRLNFPCPTIYCNARMSHGYVMIASSEGPVDALRAEVLLRIRDGAHWSVTPIRSSSFRELWQDPIGVFHEEAWLLWGNFNRNQGIQRIAIASLGAPNL